MAAIDQKPSALSVFSKGLLIENPTLRQMLGLCPTLAVTTAVTNGIGMGVATTFVLVCSGIVVSLLRNIIPTTMRLPAFITVIAGFVTIVMMVVEAYLPDLNQALGIYLPLIVVNCIVLGRAEVFASKHPVKDAALDGLGMGAGFTLTLVLMCGHPRALGRGHPAGLPYPPRHRRAHDRVHHAPGRLRRAGRADRHLGGLRDAPQAARGRAGRRGHRIAGRRVRVVSDVRPEGA